LLAAIGGQTGEGLVCLVDDKYLLWRPKGRKSICALFLDQKLSKMTIIKDKTLLFSANKSKEVNGVSASAQYKMKH
jgi:hypothetical protein